MPWGDAPGTAMPGPNRTATRYPSTQGGSANRAPPVVHDPIRMRTGRGREARFGEFPFRIACGTLPGDDEWWCHGYR